MGKLLILFICGFVPGILSQCDEQSTLPLLKRSVYEFAARLTAGIAHKNENHFVASTLSIWALLSSASLGADGETLEEFRHVLKLQNDSCFIDRHFELIRSVSSNGSVTVERSSTIFAAKGFQVIDEFRRRINDTAVSDFAVLPFDNLQKVAKTINDEVSRATHNRIKNLVAASDLEDVKVVMVDALFFKGLWQTPFPLASTTVRKFHNDFGFEVGKVNMMKIQGKFNICWINYANVLELPFGPDGRYAMLVLLPHPENRLSDVINSLTTVNLTAIYENFVGGYKPTVVVELPKFNISSELRNFKELLKSMGLKRAFDRDLAEFPLLSDTPLHISKIVQKASVQVSETGAEASAASVSYFTFRSGSEIFKADKPFFYMIVDTATQIPLFTGAYSKPSV